MMLENVILFVSIIFILVLNIVYFNSKKTGLVKNIPYEVILIFSLVEIMLDTTMYLICSTIDFEILQINNYLFFNALNAILFILSAVIILANINKISKKHLIIILISLIAIALNTLFQELVIKDIILVLINYIIYFVIGDYNSEINNKLEFAKNQVEKANRAKIDFLSSMSHEIRTPLNAIVGLSEVIKTSNDIDEIHEDANDIVHSSQNLLEIINGILDISKIEANKMDMEEVEYNPIKVFNKLRNIINTRIGEKEIELRCNFASDIPNTLYGDKYKLQQIITNILTNSVKYTEKGYIDFDVSCITEKNNCRLQITISDTGRGIKKEQMSSLFDKFQRLEEDKNTTVEGVGLGLAITKALVNMMGGKIKVHSTYGVGSKFTIILNQKITKSKDIAEDNIEEIDISFDNKRILVVDDNKLNLKVTSRMLEPYKVDTVLVESGEECIDIVKEQGNFDLILLDILMPGLDGTATLKKLKEINIQTPTVALTADAMEGRKNEYLSVGFDDYISKPIDRKELSRVLKKFLKKK